MAALKAFVPMAVLLLAALLQPTCSASEEAAAAQGPTPLPVLSVADLVDAISGGAGGPGGRGLAEKLAKQEGNSILTASLRRGLFHVLKQSPRLHVTSQRRSMNPLGDLRLEVEETGHAVTVSRAHLHRTIRYHASCSHPSHLVHYV